MASIADLSFLQTCVICSCFLIKLFHQKIKQQISEDFGTEIGHSSCQSCMKYVQPHTLDMQHYPYLNDKKTKTLFSSGQKSPEEIKRVEIWLWLILCCFLLHLVKCSILGMSLFGGKLCTQEDGTVCTCSDQRNTSIYCQCERANFDSLIWSLVTVFQVTPKPLSNSHSYFFFLPLVPFPHFGWGSLAATLVMFSNSAQYFQ